MNSKMKKDSLMPVKFVLPVALLLALAGCGSIGAIGLPWKRAPATVTQTDPMPPAPNTAVDSSDIGPPGGTTTDALPNDGTDPNQPLSPPGAGSQTASIGTGANGALGRTDLLGGWTITSAGDSCQLFMTLTSWTGGYRASTRGCTNALLKSISAWNLQNGQVMLAGQGGTPIVQLASSGNNRFEGTANGQGITFYR
jgi:hypothetical protein